MCEVCFSSFGIFISFCFSTAAAAAAADAAAVAVGGPASFCTYTKTSFSFSVWWDLPTSDFFHSRAFCFLVISLDYSTTKWNRQTRQHQGNRPDIIAGICTFPRLRSPSQRWHVMLNLTSTWLCNTNFKTWMRGWGAAWLGIVFKDAAVVSAVVPRRPTK